MAEQGQDESSDTSNGTNKENIYLRFQDMIAFEPDTAVLRESSYDFLDFFGQKLSDIEDKLAVGAVTNMYVIVEKQIQAGIIVRP